MYDDFPLIKVSFRYQPRMVLVCAFDGGLILAILGLAMRVTRR